MLSPHVADEEREAGRGPWLGQGLQRSLGSVSGRRKVQWALGLGSPTPGWGPSLAQGHRDIYSIIPGPHTIINLKTSLLYWKTLNEHIPNTWQGQPRWCHGPDVPHSCSTPCKHCREEVREKTCARRITPGMSCMLHCNSYWTAVVLYRLVRKCFHVS